MAAEGMAGLAKGLAVLEAFGGKAPRLTIAEAAVATGQSRAAARRCLTTLVDLGYLAFDGKYFSPAPRVLRLGAIYAGTATLPQLAQPHLAAAREAVNESVSLAVLDDNESLFVARSEARLIVSTGVRVGARLPLHASATGHVLLAGLSDGQLADYLRTGPFESLTAGTPTDPTALKERILQVRTHAFSISDEELEPGLRAVAVPVSDPSGRTLATMAVSVSAGRMPIEELQARVLPVLRQHADALGRQL